MMLRIGVWGIVFLLSLIPAIGYAADSQQTANFGPMTNPTPAPTRTLSVTHISQNVAANHSVWCPKATYVTNGSWSGWSPVADASMTGVDKFYPFGPGPTSNGYAVFTCAETYFMTDPYYISLINNTQVTCYQQAYPPEYCTIRGKDNNYMSGILPIHFVFQTPQQTIVRTTAPGSYNRIGMIQPYSPPLVHGSLLGGAAQSDYSAKFTTGSSYSVQLFFYVVYSTSDGGGNAGAAGGWGNSNVIMKCPRYTSFPSSSGFYNIGITNDMLGKTCVFSCDVNQINRWGYQPPYMLNGDPAIPGGSTTYYFDAPLSVRCSD